MTHFDRPSQWLSAPPRRQAIFKFLGLVSLFTCGFVNISHSAEPLVSPPVHFFHHGNLQPGLVGAIRLQSGGPVANYFQPVQIIAPPGARIGFTQGNSFSEPEPAPLTVGLLIGPVYRFRIINIPLLPGREVFPTIEVIDRVYPPLGLEWKYPIPIELTLEDLRLAVEGRFVTRVIYLEDPERALPVATDQAEQNWFEAPPKTDPLTIADQLGRPVAIVRMGGRVPTWFPYADQQFLYGSPPVLRPTHPVETQPAGRLEDGKRSAMSWPANGIGQSGARPSITRLPGEP